MTNLNESEDKEMNEVISKDQYDAEKQDKPISKGQYEEEHIKMFLFDLAALYEKYYLTYEEIESYLARAMNDASSYGRTRKFKLEK